MGYLGSSLDDYYSYQLIDHVRKQIKNKETGDVMKLMISFGMLYKEIMSLEVDTKGETCDYDRTKK